jgi:hypothetical protein
MRGDTPTIAEDAGFAGTDVTTGPFNNVHPSGMNSLFMPVSTNLNFHTFIPVCGPGVFLSL